MSKTHWISPIAIDLGAKNTGVYYTHYKVGSGLGDIQKDGKVYQLEKDKYTLLMASRTAQRHQRRGFDRRQLVKRLSKLIWEKHFGLKWDKDIQQTISFLLNRRGFTFLTEQYDKKTLSQFPKEVYDLLPNEVRKGVEKNQEDSGYDFDSALQAWSREGQEKLEPIFNVLNKEPKRIAQRQVFISRTKKLKKYCENLEEHQDNSKDRSDLSHTSDWILETWQEKDVKGLPSNDDNKTKIDLIEYLKSQNNQTKRDILNSLPNTESENTILNKSIWYFKSESFSLEKAKFNITDSEGNETEKPCIKTHLNHLAFAIYKNLEELKSGGRHRSKYFDEVKNVLNLGKENNDGNDKEKSIKQHRFLIDFCQKLESGLFKILNVEKLTHLIGHLSNLELKPLRKYFDDRCQPKPCKDNKCCDSKNHQNGDYWCECRLSFLFERWILGEWRVNPEKDKNKAKDKSEDYDKLKEEWKKHYKDDGKKDKNQSNCVIDFWLKTHPELTIPPYQDNNNRRPPKCQSLILNSKFLDQEYPDWQNWLKELKDITDVEKYLEDFESKLKNLESSKGKKLKDLESGKDKGRDKSYFAFESSEEQKNKPSKYKRSIKDLEARALQFIFDRVKVTDPLKLNEIYSHAKKIKQLKRDGKSWQAEQSNLEDALENNKLKESFEVQPDFEKDDIFTKNSFLHLVCKYYKLRQKAKDSRLFIHPEYRYIKGRGYENTGRFDDRECLLTYCNHKPRQKRYQMLSDLASVLQTSPKELEKYLQSQDKQTIDEKIVSWLKNIASLETNCERASKEQKDRRGTLKLDIQRIYGLIYHKTKEVSSSDLSNQKTKDKKIKEILKNSKIDDAHKLYNFCNRAKSLCIKVTQDLYDEKQQKKWKGDLEKNPASAIYFLAQVNNIAFKERSGNAKTCAVCSLDNAQRMVQVSLDNGKDTATKAQRLPAIETRLIDGAVMRMARIVGDAIAEDKWKKIESELNQGHKVCVPIITESNRFEFEPSKEELVKIQRQKPRKGKALERSDQTKYDKTIRESKQKTNLTKICPYTGEILGDDGEIDHIIPRTSNYGTLNDEANLIYASKKGNKNKGNQEYSLINLSSQYKQELFGGKTDQEIEKWIIEQIGDGDGHSGDGEGFKFGKYRSFINLTVDERKAFRHALFLISHPLRQKVINAINNRTRSFVNGTQRYFAEVLANKLYKKAKKCKKQHLLSFDYFGVEAQSNSRGDGISDLRKDYEEAHPAFFERYKKDNNKQEPYSHLIDAQLAFAIVADQHKKEGSLKLKIDDGISLWPIDKDTGEFFENTLFYKIKTPEENIEKYLERKKPSEKFCSHKTLFDSNPGAWHFLHLITIISKNENGEKHIEYLKGFLDIKSLQSCLREYNWSSAIKENYKESALLLSNRQIDQDTISLYNINEEKYNFGYKQKVIINNKKLGQNYFTICLSSINKEKVAEFLFEKFNTKTDPSNWQQKDCDIFKQLQQLWYFTKRKNLIKENKPNFSYQYDNLKMSGLLNHSLLKAWSDLNEAWNKGSQDKNVYEFLKSHFSIKDNQRQHQKTRKDFALPQVAKGQGFMLIKRKSWNKKFIYQCQSEKSGDSGVGLYYKRQSNDGSPYNSLTPFFRCKNIVLLKNLNEIKKSLSQNGEIIDNNWFELPIPIQFTETIQSIKNKYQSKSDSIWRIIFKSHPTIENLIDLMYGGYHIDELKVGSKDEEKKKIKKEAKQFFKDEIQTSMDNSSILEIKKLLKNKQQALISQIKDKQKNNESSQIIKKLEDRKKFIKCWINCCEALEGNVLEYKRGVPLKIENTKQDK